jgi:Dolichyl-phosphate-mannose-protein mannosyltransferase
VGCDLEGRFSLTTRALCVFGVAVFLAVRAVAWTEEFGNNDIAGIAYNAEILLDGKLPFRDTVEYKSPGPFFVFAAVFGLVKRDLRAVHVIFALWLLAGAMGVWSAARALYREADSRAVSAALATMLYLLSAGQFDLNYSSWMVTPYAWAFAALAWSLQTGRWRWRLAAGALGMLAFLFKSQAVVLAPLYPLGWWWARRRGSAGADALTWVGWLAGGTAVALPLVILYASHGATLNLLDGLFSPSTATGYVVQAPLPPVRLALGLAWSLFAFFPATVMLAAIALAAGTSRATRAEGPPLAPVLVFVVLSVAAGGMGGARFYPQYAIQYLPGLALLAAHPGGLAGELGRRPSRSLRSVAAGAAGLGVVGLIAFQLWRIFVRGGVCFDYLPPRLADGQTAAHKAGVHIRARTAPGETIQNWGWHAYPVYFWAERRAPTPLYKELGQLTNVNTNTMWTPSAPMHFKPGPKADLLLRAFEKDPPVYFVYSSYYPWVTKGGPEPLDEFTALSKILAERYVPEAEYGNLQLYVRADRAAVREPARETVGAGSGQ